MVKDNTIHGLNLFKDAKDLYVFHIPHSSTLIPSYTGYNHDVVGSEITKLTDWATDLIFDVPDTDKVVAEFSRTYCDVERFADDSLEPMSKYGRGFFYTKTDNGQNLRDDDPINKKHVFDNYYTSHHLKLNVMVNDKLSKFNRAIIIDCHSFSDVPFDSDLIKDDNRPDICIGTDEFHTSDELKNRVVSHFERLGYSVQVNSPYSGTMVNNDAYLKDNRVQSIMIEFNRKLYMVDDIVIPEKVTLLNNVIKDLVI